MTLLGQLVESALRRPSPLQRAIVAAATGGPCPSDAPLEHFGGSWPSERPQAVVLVCGVRGGKSVLASCAALASALEADCSALLPHEVPRVPLIAPRQDAAGATFRLLRGIALDALASRIVTEPTADCLVLRRDDGRDVEVRVVPASAGGLTIRGRWLAGIVLDEAAQFGLLERDRAVNAEEIWRAAMPRLLPGSQAWIVTSPYGPQGLVHSLWREHWGRPGHALAVQAPTRALNPAFPQATIDALRAREPDVAAREYDAAWTDADTTYYRAEDVDACAGELEAPRSDREYIATSDPATRSNAWTFAIATTDDDGRLHVVHAREWRGHLSPRVVLGEIAADCRRYRVEIVRADEWSADALRDLARDAGIHWFTRMMTLDARTQIARNLGVMLRERRVALPLASVPEMRADLLGTRRVYDRANRAIPHLPMSGGGRHCDWMPTLWRLVDHAGTARDQRDAAPAWEPPPEFAERRDPDDELLYSGADDGW